MTRVTFVTVVSTAVPLQPKSPGPLSQLTEPVSCNLRSLLEPGWEGEDSSQLVFSGSASNQGWGGGLGSSIQAHALTSTPACFHKSPQCFVWRESKLAQATEFSKTIHLDN